MMLYCITVYGFVLFLLLVVVVVVVMVALAVPDSWYHWTTADDKTAATMQG